MEEENDRHVWIKVETSKGMFSSERAVTFQLIDGRTVSLFADDCLLKKENGDWFLRVFPVQQFPSRHCQRVLLPAETFETATRWVDVALA